MSELSRRDQFAMALMSSIATRTNQTALGIPNTVEWLDLYLAELDRTAKPEISQEPSMGMVCVDEEDLIPEPVKAGDSGWVRVKDRMPTGESRLIRVWNLYDEEDHAWFDSRDKSITPQGSLVEVIFWQEITGPETGWEGKS